MILLPTANFNGVSQSDPRKIHWKASWVLLVCLKYNYYFHKYDLYIFIYASQRFTVSVITTAKEYFPIAKYFTGTHT